MPGTKVTFIEDFVCRLADCQTGEQRWSAMKDTLSDLGASAVIAAKVQKTTGVIDWMQSSLPQAVILDYLSEGHMNHDLIARHSAANGCDLVWRPQDGWKFGKETDGAGFANFVYESGYQSIVSSSISNRSGAARYAVTFCSEYSNRKILSEENQKRILQACKIFLPWLSWQGIHPGADYTHVGKRILSPRERDVLSYLATGLQNGQISEELCISDTMVSKHIFNARRKLEARTAAQAIAVAIRDRQIIL